MRPSVSRISPLLQLTLTSSSNAIYSKDILQLEVKRCRQKILIKSQHTIAHDASNGRIIAGTYRIAGNWAISQNPLCASAVDAVNNNWHVPRTKYGAIDGIAAYKWQWELNVRGAWNMYKYTHSLPNNGLNNCLQITPASRLSQELWHKVPQRLPKHTSTLPSSSEVPFTKWTSPSVQLAISSTGGFSASSK